MGIENVCSKKKDMGNGRGYGSGGTNVGDFIFFSFIYYVRGRWGGELILFYFLIL